MCRQLEDFAGQYFYNACDTSTQALLEGCEWYMTTNASALTLVIVFPSMDVNWRILNNIVAIGSQLERLATSAKIRVCPPPRMGTPFEIRVDEISIYRDSL